MSDFDDLDDLFGPLRSAATPAELAAEHDVVDLMAAAHPSSKGTTMFTSRRSRVATLIAAGIIGFGGVAAAGPAAYNLVESDSPVEEEVDVDPLPADESLEEVTETETETETENEEVDEETSLDETTDGEDGGEEEEPGVTGTEEPTLEAEQPTEGIDDPDTVFDEANDCKPGNHGKTVSAAARGDADLAKYEQREVAQSSCGKSGDIDETEADTETEVEVEVEVEEEVEELVERPAAQTKGKSDQAPGKSKDKGKSGSGKGNNGNGGKKGG